MSERVSQVLRLALLCLTLLWGTYTYLQYAGVQVHEAVLLPDAERQAIASSCPDGGICAGLQAAIPAVTNTIANAAPFLWYAIWSVVAFAALLGLEFMKSGKWRLKFTLSPLKIIIGFVVLLWLLFTVLSNGVNGSQPYRYVFEPSTQVYPGADAQTIQVLDGDYQELKARGCLDIIQSATQGNGVEVGQMHESCMQQSFITRVFTEVLCILYVIFMLLSFGRMWLRMLRLPERHPLLEAVFSAGLGVSSLIVILWSLSLAGIYTQLVGWVIVFALPLIAWQDSLYWLRSLTSRKFVYEAPWYGGAVLLGWLLMSWLVFNFLTVVRPFPIGWDDLGVYLNDPRLLVSYGHFIPRLGAFQWEYVTSLGFLLFGYANPFGATTSMLINWMAGLFAAMTVYTIGRMYFGKKQGFIAALAYATLPVIGHFSFADMKVDNAVFTMSALSLLAVFIALFPTHDEEMSEEDLAAGVEEKSPYHWKWMVLAGILAGFGFAMKPTTIMMIMTLNTVIGGAFLHAVGFIGVALLAWTVFVQQGTFSVKDVASWIIGGPANITQTEALLGFAIIGIAVTAYAIYLRPQHSKKALIAIALFSASFFVTVIPWVIHNNIIAGNVVPKLLLHTPNYVVPDFLVGADQVPVRNDRFLPKNLAVDPTSPACTGSTSKSEELDRYWGYQQGWSHYLGLPWRAVMNSDSVGYYVTTTFALLLFPLLLLLPYFWSKQGRWLRWLFLATCFLLLQWAFFANGILWYGIGMFLGLAVGLEAFVSRAPDNVNKVVMSVFLFLSFIITFANRFWQYGQQENLYSYPFGIVSAVAMQERTIPHYANVADTVLRRAQSMPQTPYVYRVGTFIPYFIPQNLEILPIADNQLDLFTCINQGANPALTLKRLKALGFNSIIFDTNTATIEQDPNGTLHKKVNAFVSFLNNTTLGLQVVVNDPGGGIAFVLLP